MEESEPERKLHDAFAAKKYRQSVSKTKRNMFYVTCFYVYNNQHYKNLVI